MKAYAHPEVLVEPEWVAAHLADPTVRIIDLELAPAPYEAGHIPGAVLWNGLGTLLQADWHMNFDPAAVEALCGRAGITPATTVVVYSTQPALAPWGFWFLKAVGHADVRVLNGGHTAWVAAGHALTTAVPAVSEARYLAHAPDPALRAFEAQVRAAVGQASAVLLDVRTPEEYRGEVFLLAPPEGSERAGHIPGATHVYYEAALTEAETFKSAAALASLYEGAGVTADKATITYCAVGIRSAHTWFVLTQLLGYPSVRSFDASWNVWGRLPDTPIEGGDGQG